MTDYDKLADNHFRASDPANEKSLPPIYCSACGTVWEEDCKFVRDFFASLEDDPSMWDMYLADECPECEPSNFADDTDARVDAMKGG